MVAAPQGHEDADATCDAVTETVRLGSAFGATALQAISFADMCCVMDGADVSW